MGSCLSLSTGPSSKNSMFTSTAFGRSAYVQIDKQDDVKKSLLLNEEDYYSDEEDYMDVPVRKYRLNGGRVEMEQDEVGEMRSVDSSCNLNKTLPSAPEEGDEPPFKGMVKVWISEEEGRWMWPRGVGIPVVVSEDYKRWREQRNDKIGGLRF